ncbi:type II toxin-antitoxin system RelE/ParE family toxin [Roseateles sp.]|uniref:type II toxin-antitoxin system RelE/ParE family toxin n=1 Tax=Roseateles sp. TaxID=1971397 RepID=UPI002F41CD60
MAEKTLEWRAQAVESLNTIVNHIAERNLQTAIDLFGEIRRRMKLCLTFPTLYRASQRVEGLHEITVTSNYLVPYRITPTGVEVVDIVHSRRDWPNPPQ